MKKAQTTNKKETGLIQYTPELGDKMPNGCDFLAVASYYGGIHYSVYSLKGIELKGVGIKYNGLNIYGQKGYCLTQRAFNKLCKEHMVCEDCILY